MASEQERPFRFVWEDAVRRSKLDRTTKYIALLVSSYASLDGTNAYPGVARLAVESTLSAATVRRALDKLRRVGLLEVASRGNRRKREADEYRLIFAENLLDKLDIPTPDAHAEAIAVATEPARARSRERVRRWTNAHPDERKTSSELTLTQMSAEHEQRRELTLTQRGLTLISDPTNAHPDERPRASNQEPPTGATANHSHNGSSDRAHARPGRCQRHMLDAPCRGCTADAKARTDPEG